MPDVTHPTRQALLDAGIAIADDAGLTALSVDEVVRRAGVAKGTFYVHFKDQAGYLVALHRQFHDGLRATIDEHTRDQERGLDRLRRGATAYLDGCLRAKGVKAMLAQARGRPEIARAVAAENDWFAHDVEQDFTAAGSAHARESARLFVAMTAEVALQELEGGKRLPRLRTALLDYLDGVSG